MDPGHRPAVVGQEKWGSGSAHARCTCRPVLAVLCPAPMSSCSSCLGTSLPVQPCGGAERGSTRSPFPTLHLGADAQQQLSGAGVAGLALGYFFPSAAVAGSWGWGGEAAWSEDPLQVPGSGDCRAARPTCRVRVRARWWLSSTAGMGVTAVLPCPGPGDVPRGVPAEPPGLGLGTSLLSCREGYGHGQAAAPTACSIPSRCSGDPRRRHLPEASFRNESLPTPEATGEWTLPQQFILPAAWLPSWNGLPSPELSPITFALS